MGDSEPLGQLLIEMLVALTNNMENSEDDQPIYGCYIYGSIWKFVVVWQENQENFFYSQGETYDATKLEDLHQIWLILNAIKSMVEIRALKQFNKSI